MSIEQVEVTPRSLTMRVGEQRYDLRATVYPGNTTCKNVRWESSAPSVVSVNESSGYLHALSGGDAVITAIVDDGTGAQHYGCCDIYVDDSYNDEDPNLRYNVPGNCSVECSSPGYSGGSGGSTECNYPGYGGGSGGSTECNYPGYGGGSGNSGECPPFDDGGDRGSDSCGYWCPREEDYTINREVTRASETTHADPVDVYSGAHLLDLAVLKLFEGRNLELKAHYRSDCLVKGKMGIGWYHDFEKHLKHDKCNIKVYSTPSSYTNYDSSDCVRYTSSRPEKLGFVLTYTQGAQYPYCLDCNSKRKEYYDASGRLAQIIDHQGYVTNISYRSNAIVVTDASVNKSITLEINTAGRITRDTGAMGIPSFTYEVGKGKNPLPESAVYAIFERVADSIVLLPTFL